MTTTTSYHHARDNSDLVNPIASRATEILTNNYKVTRMITNKIEKQTTSNKRKQTNINLTMSGRNQV